MSVGFTPGGPVTPGGVPFSMGEPFTGDPRVAPGLPRPIGWEVRRADGTAAYLKKGPLDTDWISFADLGGGGPSSAFLNDVYAAGLVDVTTHEVMAMHSGNLRFRGDIVSGGLPGWAFFEKPSGAGGDSRFGTSFTRRYYPVAQGVGGFVVHEIVEGDPAWNGTFGGLGGIQIADTVVGANNNMFEDTGSLALAMGQRIWGQIQGFFDGPDCFPLPGFNSGSRFDHWLDLWNDNDQGQAERHRWNGYGQYIHQPQPRNAGITAAFDTEISLPYWPAAARNGIGWFVRRHDEDPPRAVLDAYHVDLDTNSDWGWELWGRSTAANDTQRLFSIDWVNGAIFNVPATFAGTTPAVVAYYNAAGPDIDLTVASSGYPLVPSLPGKTFIPLRLQVVQTATNGAITTPATIAIKNGATVLFTGTGLTDSTAFAFGVGGLTQTAPTQGTMSLVTPTTLDVVTPATGTGGFQYRIRAVVTGFYV